MAYVAYILVIIVIVSLCLFLLPEKDRGPSFDKKARKTDSANKPNRSVHTPNRETPIVPTPWGWPGHATAKNPAIPTTREAHRTSESLPRFVDSLLSGKQTVENNEYLLKKHASLKALLEDRYGRVLPLPETNKENGRPPLVRHPSTTVGMKKLQELKTPWGW